MPRSITTLPTSVYRKNLIAEYKRRPPPQMPIRKYIAICIAREPSNTPDRWTRALSGRDTVRADMGLLLAALFVARTARALPGEAGIGGGHTDLKRLRSRAF